MIYEWFCQILNSPDTSQVLLNTSIAILTIFIPLAISLFETNKDPDYASLDRAVILDHLIKGPRILWELSLLFLPIFFWQVESYSIHFLVIILWSLGLYFAIEKLTNCYKWIRGNRFSYRFAYLSMTKIYQEMEDLWRSVWNAKDINRENEKQFFNIFKQKVEEILSTENINELKILLKLFQDFEILIDKRDILFLTSKDDVFPEILNWHYRIWEREHDFMDDGDDLEMFGVFYPLSTALDRIVQKVEERALKEHWSFGFFELVKKHIEIHKTDSVQRGDKTFHYIESFLAIFYSKFFDLIMESKHQHDIWSHYFPNFLKITESNLEDLPAQVSLHLYLEWAIDKIRGDENKENPMDVALEEVTKEMFPDTEPIFWSIVLTFLMRPWGSEGRIKSLIDHSRKFGYFGRIMVWSGISGEAEPETSSILTQQTNNLLNQSISLLIKIFGKEFSLDKVNGYIRDLEDLNYSEDARKESYRKQILEYMNKIKQHLESR